MRAERLVALLFTLQSRRSATIPELAAALEVSERTMHRDIAALLAAGVPLWTETGRNGGVRLVDGWRSRLDGLTSREAVALFAMGAPRALAELGLGAAVTAARAKVSATLPAELREHAELVAQRFHLDAPGWFRREEENEHLAAVARAVWAQRRVRVGYRRGSSDVVDRVLDPLGLVLKAGVWYLVARAAEPGAATPVAAEPGAATPVAAEPGAATPVAAEPADVRTYRVARLTGADELAESFDRPPQFDLAAWWERSSAEFERSLRAVRVRVRLSPRGVRALPHVLGAEHAVEVAGPPGADGWTDVVLGLEEPRVAAGQLIALGPDVEVVEPPEVRAAYVAAVREMLDRHA